MDDRFRVSEADRDRATALLRDHFAAGRLTAHELDERLATALGSKTFGDLRRVLADLPGIAPAFADASPGTPDAVQLARGYRRLLSCYPVWYRRFHEEEMLAVLMTEAPQGKRRPGIADAADLLWGALRIRCQPSRAGAEPAWRDALAVLSVIVPLIVVLSSVADGNQFLAFLPARGLFPYGFPLWVLKALAAPLALGALVPLGLRMRRLAALAGAGLLIWFVSDLRGYLAPFAIGDFSVFLAAGLVTAALAASRGPRRGVQILTWKHAAVVLIVTMLVCTSAIPMDAPLRPVVRLTVIGVTGAGMALASSRGRWLVLLLAIPAYPMLLFNALSLFPGSYGYHLAPMPADALTVGLPVSAPLIAEYCLPSLALAALAVLAARRASARSAKPLGAPE
jgi:hypothetical protein